MSFAELVHSVLDDTVQVSLQAFLPELTLCGTIVALLLCGMLPARMRGVSALVMVAGLALALYLVFPWRWLTTGAMPASHELFTGLLVHDSFAVVMRALLIFFALLLASFTLVSGLPRLEDAGEFHILVLGALLGMCLMTSANHLLIVFLAVEMASVPSYVLAGFLRQRRASSEAALKYAVFGAGAAGVMLYGISLLAGSLGAAHLPTAAARLAELHIVGLSGPQTMGLVLAGLMLAVGIAFKLSAVPFHFWAPDVFEGAPAEVGAFLSVASKAAALALLVRLVIGFGTISPEVDAAFLNQHNLPSATTAAAPKGTVVFASMDATAVPLSHAAVQNAATSAHPVAASGNSVAASEIRVATENSVVAHLDAATLADGGQRPLLAALQPTRRFMAGLLALLAAVTCTFGNLAAYGQTNMKRLLAYSTIAHAGYLMMPLAALALLLGNDMVEAQFAVAALVVYLVVYLFMNLGAFALVAVLRNASGSEAIASYAGLVRRSPMLAICAAVILFSLVGLPPLAGFVAKFAIFAALVKAGMLSLLLIGGLNTLLSLFYYLRVVRVMILDAESSERPAAAVPFWSTGGLYCAALTLPLIVLFVWADGVFAWAMAAVSTLVS